MKLVGQFKALAAKKGYTPSQLALAWLLKQGDNRISIPGTKKIKYFEENWASLRVQLSDNEEQEIRKFVETAEVAGHPGYPGYIDTVEEKYISGPDNDRQVLEGIKTVLTSQNTISSLLPPSMMQHVQL